MDLQQNKLARAEWDSIEVPIMDEEKQILKMMIQGYTNPNMSIKLSPWFFAFIYFYSYFVYLFVLSFISSLCGQIPSGHSNLSERLC